MMDTGAEVLPDPVMEPNITPKARFQPPATVDGAGPTQRCSGFSEMDSTIWPVSVSLFIRVAT